MGMGASQAKLLCLTARQHDVEHKAQQLMNQKLSLATQNDQAYMKYCEALDKTTIQVAYDDGNNGRVFVDATFANVCEYDPTRCKQYTLTDTKTGKLFVSEETARQYEKFKNDKYGFAWSMMIEGGFEESWFCSNSATGVTESPNIGIGTVDDNELNIFFTNSSSLEAGTGLKELYEFMESMLLAGDLFMTDAEALVMQNYISSSYDPESSDYTYRKLRLMYTNYLQAENTNKRAQESDDFAKLLSPTRNDVEKGQANALNGLNTAQANLDNAISEYNNKLPKGSKQITQSDLATMFSPESLKEDRSVEAAYLALVLASIAYHNAVSVNAKDSEEDNPITYDNSQIAKLKEDAKTALATFRRILYENHASEIYQYMRIIKQGNDGNVNPQNIEELELAGNPEFSKEQFNYYLNLYECIQNAGGCTPVPPEAEVADSANDWFNSMIKTGRAIINVYNESTKEWGETTVGTSTNKNFLQENQDEKMLKKAEADYEYELSVINKKDSQMTNELKKLETQEQAIKQEMQSIKEVLKNNIEKTYNIFG